MPAGSGTTGHVEYYESYKDEWTEADSLRVGRSAASACTIKGLDSIQDYTFYGKEARFLEPPDGFDWQVLAYIPLPKVCSHLVCFKQWISRAGATNVQLQGAAV